MENIYHIPSEQILHIHSQAGKNNLKLGYPQGNFKPEKYLYDVRAKGRGHYAKMKTEDYVNSIEGYYVKAAYEKLLNKCKSFYKKLNLTF